MGLEDVPRCQHVKVNGTQCGSPALRSRRLCYFHNNVQRQRRKIAADTTAPHRFDLPLLEDANSVQMALMKVIQMLGSGRMDHKTAGLMLYALQTASVNLRYTDLETEEITDIVIDRDTVNGTRINGPQWFEEDFEDEPEEAELEDDESEDDESEIEAADTEAAETEDQEAVKDEADVHDPAQASSVKKKPKSVQNSPAETKHITLEEAQKGVQAIARKWVQEMAGKPAG
jgi:hypothetical protein